MKLYKNQQTAYLEIANTWFQQADNDWNQLINRTNLYHFLKEDLKNWTRLKTAPVLGMDAPIDQQEVWAAGVTYLRSKVARMEESKKAGGGDFYDKVYDADRPELFFKATAARTVGHGDRVFIRRDSLWNVPEPELTLFCSSAGTIEGYTIGNDMSSRSIEGENPLYLPQAKTYERSAALGPCILVLEKPIPKSTTIEMEIFRDGQQLYTDRVAIQQIKRSLTELVDYLFKECNFPYGCFLMTGTCLVPPDDFTLELGDEIRIRISGIGELVSFVGMRGIL
ncbi:MAG: fumarylacetoacetate hydrolase family protein [Bacteroidota bacterium]